MALQPAIVGLPRVGNTRVGYIPASMRGLLYVNGVSRTHYYDRYSVDILDDLNEAPNTCTFECFGFTPAQGDVVKMLSGSVKDFEGTVVGITEYHDKLNARTVYRVACTDYTRSLDADLVTKAYGSQSATTTAQDIITNFTSGFTQVNIVAALPTVAAIQFKMTPVSSALRQLCDAIGGDAYVDYDKDVHVFVTETTVAPDTINASNAAFKKFKYTSAIDRVANRIYVEGLGLSTTAAVAIGATSIPVQDVSPFSSSGGLVVQGNQVITYTSTSAATDAAAWTLHTLPTLHQGDGVAWSPSLRLFVSVDHGSGKIVTSPDGATWTTRTTPATVTSLIAVTWAASISLFVAVGQAGTDRVATSPDGITWTARSASSAALWRAIAWSPTLALFVAVAQDGFVMTSPDGITWTARTSASASSAWFGVEWSPSLALFVVVGALSAGTNAVMTSPDGVTWTGRTSSFDLWAIAWSPTLAMFAATAQSGASLKTSTDGITWTTRTAASSNQWHSIVWSPDLALFLAVASTGTGRVMTSSDGITWESTGVSFDLFWNSVAWSPELGIFVATGSSRNVMTSNPAPKLTGVPASGTGSVVSAIANGDNVNLLVQRDDTTSQGTYGIRKAYVQDRRLSIAGAQARGDAELTLRKDPFITGSFVTTDTKVRSGRRIPIAMSSEWGISGTFTITKVRMFWKEGDPRLQREVTFASNAGQSDLFRLLRRVRENQQQNVG